jgi:hypothetical protein
VAIEASPELHSIKFLNKLIRIQANYKVARALDISTTLFFSAYYCLLNYFKRSLSVSLTSSWMTLAGLQDHFLSTLFATSEKVLFYTLRKPGIAQRILLLVLHNIDLRNITFTKN